jgi:hypothetical protein
VLAHFRLKTFVVVLVICWVVKDNYPFSHFPMYDKFPDHTFYIFLKDGEDKPVPLQVVTGTRTSTFKKPYDKALNRVRKDLKKRKRELTVAERESSGLDALTQLYNNAPDEVKRKLEELSPLRLYHAEVDMTEEGIVEREPELIAELSLPLTP